MQLSEYHWGDSGPRILLVHGLSSNAGSWWRIIDHLAPHARLTAIDLRGHGATGAPGLGGYTLAEYASDLPREDWDAVVGHSLGGAVSVLAAQHSGFARKLLLLDPVLEVAPQDYQSVIDDQGSELTLDEETIAAAKPHWDDRDRASKLEGVRSVVPEAVARSFTDAGSWNVVAEAESLTVPTLILGGDHSVYSMLSTETAARLVSANPRIEYRVVAGAGHSPHRDRPDETLRVIREWLLGH